MEKRWFFEILKDILILFFVNFIICDYVYGLNINEINYNPTNQTYVDEYIEIYGHVGFNISDFIICDQTKCNSIVAYNFVNSTFALITVNGSNYVDVNASVYFVNSTRIGNGLNNDGDCVYFYTPNFSFLIDFICYPGNGKKGNSFQFFNGLWQECQITPGYENFCQQQEQQKPKQQPNQNFFIFYPTDVLNKRKEFVVLIDAVEDMVYDVKIDVTKDDERLSEIWDENENRWKSTYYYVTNVTLVNKTFVLRINNNYSGIARMDIKIRKDSKVESFAYLINIHDYFLPDQDQQQKQQQKQQTTQAQAQTSTSTQTQTTQTTQTIQTQNETSEYQQDLQSQFSIQTSTFQQPHQKQQLQQTQQPWQPQPQKPIQTPKTYADRIAVNSSIIILPLLALTTIALFLVTFKKLILFMLYGRQDKSNLDF